IQVSVGDAELLKKSNTHAELIVVKGMNHILKIVPEDKSENIKSYGNPDLPIAAELVAQIVSFIRK
ncbi:MAG: alpha/beta hydrolase, partial [Bacteroidota bacterium]